MIDYVSAAGDVERLAAALLDVTARMEFFEAAALEIIGLSPVAREMATPDSAPAFFRQVRGHAQELRQQAVALQARLTEVVAALDTLTGALAKGGARD